jgi:hypothetical protein
MARSLRQNLPGAPGRGPRSARSGQTPKGIAVDVRSGGHQYPSPPTKSDVRYARAVVLVPLCRLRTWRASSSSMRSVDLTENGHCARAAVQPWGRADQHRPPLLVAHACWSLADRHEPQRLNALSELICDPCRDPCAASSGRPLGSRRACCLRRPAPVRPHLWWT